MTNVRRCQSSYDDDDDDYDYDYEGGGLFQEAEEFFNKSFQTLLAVGTTSCGLEQFKGKGSKKDRGKTGFELDEGVLPDWRKDPYHSMSDWTLIVRDGTQNQPQSYHIHKSVISYGKRMSGFLTKSFQQDIMENGGRKKKGAGTNEIALSKRAAQCVPQLLDFIYFDQLDLNAENAPSLRHLANTFDVRELYALASSFIQSDINESTITTYIREAEAVKDQELATLGMTIAATKFDLIPDESLLALQPHVFQQLTSNPQLNCASSERLSQRVAVYSRGRAPEINDEVFYFMTHAQILPFICPTEAMWYLNFAASKFANVLIDDSMGGYEGTLKRRCIVAAAKDWKNILVESVRKEVRRKIEGDVGSVTGGDNARRRLFIDGDNETKIDKGRGYMSLPMDIRIELLEEALLNAATTEGSNANSELIGGDEMISTSYIKETVPTEHRGDVGKREKRRGRKERREKRVAV